MADDRARAPQVLREEEAFLALAETLSALIALVQGDKLVYVNPAGAALLGYPQEYYKGRNFWDFALPEDREAIATRGRARQIGIDQPRRFTERLRHADGRVLWVDYSVDVLQLNGKTTTLVTGHDITERMEAERLLQDSEQRFRDAFENAAIGKAITSVDMQFLQVNRAYCDMLGYTKEQLLVRNPIELTHPDDLRENRELVWGLVEGRRSFGRLVKRYLHRDGRIVWADLTTTLVRDSEGKPVYFVTEAVDITERRRAEELLRDREAKLTEAQRIAKLGRWEWDVEKDLVTWSEEMFKIFGLRPEEFAGTYEAVLSRIHEEDRKRIASQVAHSVQKGTPHEQEYRTVLPNGELRHVWATNFSVEDATGRVVRMYGVARDITERKLAEEQIRDREAKLNEAQKVAKIGSWRYDIASNTSVWSDEMYRIFDVDPATFNPSKENAYARFHPEDLPQVAQIVERAIRDGEPFEFDARLPHGDGTVLHLHAIGRANRDASGKPATLYGTLQDVTERRAAEGVIRDREAKLAEAQRIAHIGGWEWDLATSKISWSEEIFRILGLDPSSQAAGYEAYMSRIHPEDRADLEQLVDRAIREGRPYESQHRIVRDSGEVRRMWASGRLDLDDSGKPVRLYGIIQDITERKQAEEALRANEQRFRNLYSQAPVMMTAMDPEGRVREVSNYWLKVMGYERDEVIGRDGFRFVTADSKLILEQGLAETLLSGERVVRNLPVVGVRKDGSNIDILITSVLEMDPDGKPLGAIAVGIDVSDIRRAEEAVRESEARYRALVEHAPEAIVVLDLETGKYIDLNKNAEILFGYSRDELLCRGPLDISPPTQPCGRLSSDVAWEYIGRVMRGETVTCEFIHTHSSGREIPVTVRLSRMPATGQNLIRATITDVSDQKALEEKVRHAEKMAAVGLLAAGVAHEIGNPLLALSMAAQSLERRSADEYAQKKLGLIREHIERISKIVRQMSDLARPQSAQRSPCDVNRVLERAVEIVRYDKRAKEVPIRFEPGPDVPLVRGVEDQLMQVCLNLALNALDAVAANPLSRPKSLRVSARRVTRNGKTYVRASFLDSGPGIPEEARPKIFQPFFTTKSSGKGTGLGLSVSYRIIEEHQGTLAFECRPADGTEFYFDLPVQEKP